MSKTPETEAQKHFGEAAKQQQSSDQHRQGHAETPSKNSTQAQTHAADQHDAKKGKTDQHR
jgi:hypothetical protein